MVIPPTTGTGNNLQEAGYLTSFLGWQPQCGTFGRHSESSAPLDLNVVIPEKSTDVQG